MSDFIEFNGSALMRKSAISVVSKACHCEYYLLIINIDGKDLEWRSTDMAVRDSWYREVTQKLLGTWVEDDKPESGLSLAPPAPDGEG